MNSSGSGASIVRGWQRFWGGSSAAQRLRDLLPAFRQDLEGLVRRGRTRDGAGSPWCAQADDLLRGIDKAMARGNTEEGWRLFHAAQRVEIHGLRELDPAAFRARGQSIYNEATSKLRSWRLKQVTEFGKAWKPAATTPAPAVTEAPEPDAVSPAPGQAVTKAPKPDASGPTPTPAVTAEEFAAVVESAVLLHEHFSNEAFKEHGRIHQTRLVVGLGLGATVLWLLTYGACVFQTGEELKWTGALLHSALLFGLMGASFSALTSLAGQSTLQTIPEQCFTYRITLGRLAVGVLSALVVCVLLASGFLQIGSYPVTPSLVFLGAFAAGFSERMVVRALERFAGVAEKVEQTDRATAARTPGATGS